MAQQSGRTWAQSFGPYLTMGIQLALSVVVFFFAGRWLDGELGTAPWLMLAGLLVGIAGGLIKFVRAAVALGKEANKNAEEERAHGQGRD
ncbi:MAG: putative F0F1-ATPase subunit Ca2+/Mg2+ transporter [Bacteroidetes bacterium]|nr:putative F0F1-ATPase subunit Ca2+/Mg2+ transporter [Bacteroidota bacterium]